MEPVSECVWNFWPDAAGTGGRITWNAHSVRLPHAGKISPNKNMNCPCTTAAFTLSPAPVGIRHLVLTRPGTGPSMRFLSVVSHFCAQASFEHPLTGLPLRRLVVTLVQIPDTTGAPTGDSHPISSCPCRAYTRRSASRRQKAARLSGVVGRRQ